MHSLIIHSDGMGTNQEQLLITYWDRQRIVPKTGKFLRKEFRTGRGLTQGDPTSTMILKKVVDAVVWAVLDVVCGPQEAQNGLGWAAGEQILIFYSDDGRMAEQYHVWDQDAMLVTVAMFRRIGLETNLENTKTMVCTPGFIWGNWGEHA